MAEQVDVYKLIVEVEGAQTIGQLETGLKTLRDELKNQKIGSKEFTELSTAIKDTELQLDSAGKTAQKAGSGISAAFGNAAQGIASGFQSAFGAMAIFTNGSDQATEAMARLQGLMQLKEGIGGIKNSIVQMSGLDKAVAKGIKGFNGLKVAMMSIGIGALIAAIGAVIAAFSRFDSMMEKLEVGISAVKGAFDAIIDTIALLGSALIKLFSGDFKGAAKDATEAITGFNNRMKESVTNATEATKAAQQLEDAEIGLIVTQAKLRRSIAENREVLSDENATIQEKVKALANARKASKEYYDNELRLAKENLRILQLQSAARVELTDDQRRAIEEAKAKLDELEASRANEERTLNKAEKRINSESEAKRKEAAERRKKQVEDDIKLERERLEILGQLTIEKEKEFLDRRLKAGIIGKKEYNNAVLKLDVEYQKMVDKQNAELIDSQAAVSKLLLQLTKEQLDEELKLNSDYLKQRQLQLMNDLLSGGINDKEYKDALLAEQENALQSEIDLRLMYGEDATDLLIKQAQIEIDINKQKNEQILKDDQDIYEAKMMLAQQSSNVLGAITDLIITEYGKQNDAAKAAALLQLGVDTAMAFVDGLRIAQQGAKATGPAAPFAFPIFYASQVASILTAVNKAKQILGGGASVGQTGFNAPSVNNEPQTVRAITGQQTLKSVVLVKDINNAQNKLSVIDGNSFIIE